MTNLPSDITAKALKLILKFELNSFDFKNIDEGQPFTLNYEKKRYRQDELARLLFSLLPYFALTNDEFADYSSQYSPEYLVDESIKRIVKPGKKAGDYGEIILFLLLDLFYGSKKLVTKVFYKTPGDVPVFGADATHFTKDSDGQIAFWFGESKFYKDFGSALDKAFISVEHFLEKGVKKEIDFLTPSRIEINRNVDKDLYEEVRNFIIGNPSLDQVKIKIPVLITYEMNDLDKFDDEKASEFLKNMKVEFENRYKQIQQKVWSKPYKKLAFVFFLLPIQDVKAMKDLIRQKDEGIRA